MTDPGSQDKETSICQRTVSGQLVMPFYVMLDVSASMTNDMATLNDSVWGFRERVAQDPDIEEIVRISVLIFSDNAKVVVPLDAAWPAELPLISAEGGTNYGCAFTTLAHVIESDRARLASGGVLMFRPCILFLTDGEPLDADWMASFKETLVCDDWTGDGTQQHPCFVSFGFRDAREDVLACLAQPLEEATYFLATSSAGESAITDLFDLMTETVVLSARSGSMMGVPMHRIPIPAESSEVIRGRCHYSGGDVF